MDDETYKILEEIENNPFYILPSFIIDLRNAASKLEKLYELENKHGYNYKMVETTTITIQKLKNDCDFVYGSFDSLLRRHGVIVHLNDILLNDK